MCFSPSRVRIIIAHARSVMFHNAKKQAGHMNTFPRKPLTASALGKRKRALVSATLVTERERLSRKSYSYVRPFYLHIFKDRETNAGAKAGSALNREAFVV